MKSVKANQAGVEKVDICNIEVSLNCLPGNIIFSQSTVTRKILQLNNLKSNVNS